jgi:DNA-binding Lrp family transcriptional regulator
MNSKTPAKGCAQIASYHINGKEVGMSLNVQNLCELTIEAHGGRERLEGIKTLFVVYDQTRIRTPAKSSIGGLQSSRRPVVPSVEKVYRAIGRDGGVHLRVESLSEYHQVVILINNDRGTITVRPSPQIKKLWTPGMPVLDKSQEPLSEGLVRGNLFSHVYGTPLAFMLDHRNRNAQYKGVTEVLCSILDTEKRACHMLQFTRPDGSGLYELAIDIEEMLCRIWKIHYGKGTGETIYADYRRVDGVMEPHASKSLIDNNALSVTKLQRIEFDRELPENIFTQV